MTVTVNHAVKEFKRNGRLQAIVVEDRATGELKEWQYDGVFVFIGLTPNSQLAQRVAQTNQWGFVLADKTLMTSAPGLFGAWSLRRRRRARGVYQAGGVSGRRRSDGRFDDS